MMSAPQIIAKPIARVRSNGLLWCEWLGKGALGHAGPVIDALLIGSGPRSALALFLYAYGVRRLRYSTVGLLQSVFDAHAAIRLRRVLHEPARFRCIFTC